MLVTAHSRDFRRARLWVAVPLLTFGLMSVAEPRERGVKAGDVCVTNGVVEKEARGRFVINSPSSRAVVKGSDDSAGAIKFEYLGPAAGETKLASGVVRRQLGVKLRAEDSCNVIYVMWGIEPEPGLVVSMKVNEGKTTHAQCGVKGYKLVPARFEKPVAPIKVGEPRTLAASLDENRKLTVRVDGDVVWEGIAFPTAKTMYGYTGIRTDNVRVRFEWLADDNEVPASRRAGRAAPKVVCNKVQG
ncbi:hypothetical protein [uncultured Piscinibacter sp.]|uniref:hypothetical protein n=1 Tax=uncultured Piscinibacter sp. TaxID=1131835 RepID=UPI00260299CF|nr:hypothetical protein [uncultured Piscinibacter sp.]